MSNEEEQREPTFGEAITELEAIIASIEREDVDLDDLADRVDRAATLIELCRGRIDKTQSRVRTIIDGMARDGSDEEGS